VNGQKILIVDDDPEMRKMLSECLSANGYAVLTASDGMEAVGIVEKEMPDLVLLDMNMPGIGGMEVLARLSDVYPDVKVVMMTGLGSHDKVMDTMVLGAHDFLAKPFPLERLTETVQRVLGESPIDGINGASQGRLKRIFWEILTSMVNILEAKDAYTMGHSVRVAEYATATARRMRLSDQEIEILHYAGALHDLGKVGVSDLVLRKPGKLDDAEWAIIRAHPEKSVEILKPIRLLRAEEPAIRHHHERFDGQGYPDGKKEDEIPLLARILAVADSYDAMTSTRTYRKPLTTGQARLQLKQCSGTQFDPAVVEAFLKLDL
jgi:putative two-component system response regulator